jgi:Flp pilus assembly protein TadG
MKFPTRLRVLCKSEHGAALVELALVIAFILPPLLVGAIDFGRYYYAGIALTNIAHAGAAYGSQNPTSGSIATAASKVTPTISNVAFDAPVPKVILECDDGVGSSTNLSVPPVCTSPALIVYKVQVTATATYSTIVPGAVWLTGMPSSFTMSRTAIIRGCYPQPGVTNC